MVRNRRQIGPRGTASGAVELLLAEDVNALGKQGEIVRVKAGYARNFLLPQGLATIATEHNKRMVDRHRKRVDDLQTEKIKSLRSLADAVGRYSATLEANANDEGHLYGSIVAADISKVLKAADFAVEPEHIKLEGPLKELGMYTVAIELHAKAKAELKVWVVPAATA